MRILRTLTRVIFAGIVLLIVVGGAGAGFAFYHFGRDLPDSSKLKEYVPAVGSKVYAADGTLMADFESQHRIFVPIGKIPKMVKDAFIAAEDRDFYAHKGVNPAAVLRAAATDLMRMGRHERPVGASTITQQVARHFLLTNEVSISRKIKEIMLAYRIDGELSKDRILEIYLNEIYLGAGAYGVAAAADTYFQKPLDQLTPADVAFLAALPKAPNNYNPVKHHAAAKARRDWVLAGMAETGALTKAQAKQAIAQPLGVHVRPAGAETKRFGYFAEEVRRELIAHFSEKQVYEGGLTVHTSYTPTDQAMAERAFRNGLMTYDRRHGWRGPVQHAATAAAAQAEFAKLPERAGIPAWRLAAVTGIDRQDAAIVLKDGGKGYIPRSDLSWARRTLPDQRLGPSPRAPSDVLSIGDIVYVEPAGAAAAPKRGAPAEPQYSLRQIPDVSGGFIVLDPKSGRVMAMVGGWDFTQSQFNRATQAWRQPGSAIKPLVYVTAMDDCFTPNSVVDDAPIELPQGPGLPPWNPVNYEGTSSGPSTLRDALIHSKNLVTARLATMIGMPAIVKTVENFDVMDRMPPYYSMALGAGETTLLRLATAYGMLDNGGHWLLPSFIDTVQDRDGNIIYQKGVDGCEGCYVDAASTPGGFKSAGAPDPASARVKGAKFAANTALYKPTKPDPLVSETADLEILSMMQGVVQQGTGIAAAAVGKPLAGKTGTTNDFNDAWFVGFTPNLVAGGYVGFDQPRTLGNDETGGHVVAPIFRDFMADALKNAPATPFPAPPASAEPASASRDSGQGYGSTEPDPNDRAQAPAWAGAGAGYGDDERDSYPQPNGYDRRRTYGYDQYPGFRGREDYRDAAQGYGRVVPPPPDAQYAPYAGSGRVIWVPGNRQ